MIWICFGVGTIKSFLFAFERFRFGALHLEEDAVMMEVNGLDGFRFWER